MPDLVVDIETVAPAWSELDPPVREYLTERARRQVARDGLDVDPEEHAADRLALELGLARIVATGIWRIDERRGAVLLADLESLDESMPGWVGPEYHASEADVLREFWRLVGAARGRIVTFNGRGYDAPVLMVRSAQLGIPCARDLVGYRYDISQHCDLMDALTFMGATRQTYGLDYWCRAFGVDSPKQGVTGADVAALYAAGDYAEIARYVLRDVEATAALYERMTPMLAALRGGPAYVHRESQAA